MHLPRRIHLQASECRNVSSVYLELSSRIQTYRHRIINADSTSQKKNIMAALSFGKSVILIRFPEPLKRNMVFFVIFIVIHILFCHLSLFFLNIHLNIKVASSAHYASKRLD